MRGRHGINRRVTSGSVFPHHRHPDLLIRQEKGGKKPTLTPLMLFDKRGLSALPVASPPLPRLERRGDGAEGGVAAAEHTVSQR